MKITTEGGDELVELETILVRAGDVAAKDARAAVSKGLLNIKTDARKRIGRPTHARAYPNAITYDTRHTATTAQGEVGPDKDRRQGALGNILEFGTVNNPPHPHMGPAGEAERPRFERAIEDLAARAIER